MLSLPDLKGVQLFKSSERATNRTPVSFGAFSLPGSAACERSICAYLNAI